MANGTGSRSSLPVAGLAGVVLTAVAVLVSHQVPYLGTRPPEPAKFPDLSLALQHVDARLWQDPFSAVEDFERREVARRTFDSDAGKAGASTGSGKSAAARADERPFATVRFGVTVEAFGRLMGASDSATTPVSRPRALPVLMSGSHFVGAEEARRRTRYAVLAALDELGYAPVDGDHIGYVVAPGAAARRGAPPVRVPFEAYKATRAAPGLPADVIVLWVDEAALTAPDEEGSTWLDTLAGTLRVLGVCPPEPKRCEVPVIGPSSSDRYETLTRDLNPSKPAVLPWLVSPFVTSNLLEDPRIQVKLRTSGLTVVATIVPDSVVIDALLRELLLRKVPLCDPSKYVVLVGEWDTQYARRARDTFTEEFDAEKCGGAQAQTGGGRAIVRSFSFVRGLDGVAIGTPVKGATSLEEDLSVPLAGSAQLEWPESADQRDYVRRIGQQLSQLRLARNIVAVGVLASDTHDKILLLQALRGLFPRAVFFTTDVDARYMHPLVQPWTRNLIVAGAYGLVLGEELQLHTPPFRDGYQTSTFLATSAALQLPAAAAKTAALDWGFLGKQPVQLFEVGRTRLVPLLPDTGESTDRPRCRLAALEGCRQGLQPRYAMMPRGRRVRAALSLLWVASSVGMLGWAWRNPGGRVTRWTSTGAILSYVFLAGLVGSLACFARLLWQVAYPTTRAYPPEPLLFAEGVSSWPIALLWCFGLALTFMFLARIARTLGPRIEATRDEFLGAPARANGEEVGKKSDGYWDWLKSYLCFSQPASAGASSERTPFAEVWKRYQRHAQGWRRVARIAVVWVVLFAFPFLLVHGAELAPPPVIRGPFQQVLWQLDIWHFLMLTVLMAAVADSAILCTLFVVDVSRQRRQYPKDVREAFCKRLGLHADLKPYIDEYINCELIEGRTAAVAGYLYYPFIVLAVLAVAMTSLFDDWVFTLARVGLYAFYIGVLLLLWLGLHAAATRARVVALAEMDTQWIALQRDQAGDQKAAETMRRQFPLLMEHVRNLRLGAYGPLFGQPIFRALLLPLGSVSSTQLVQYLFLR